MLTGELAVRMTTARQFDQLLHRLGGRLRGDFVADLRTRLAGGHVAEVADAVVFAAVAEPVALTGAEIDLLIDTLAGHGAETTMARAVSRAGRALPGHPG